MRTWITSDTHFNHEKLLSKQRKDFKFVGDADNFIIETWNSVVAPNDEVYHLGDFAFGDIHNPNDAEYIKKLYSRLNGKIKLIIGNHDTDNKIRFYIQNNMFEKILPVVYIDELVLSHHPVHPVTFKEEHKYNIHGHIHTGCIDDKRYFNVNWDVHRQLFDFDSLRTVLNDE